MYNPNAGPGEVFLAAALLGGEQIVVPRSGVSGDDYRYAFMVLVKGRAITGPTAAKLPYTVESDGGDFATVRPAEANAAAGDSFTRDESRVFYLRVPANGTGAARSLAVTVDHSTGSVPLTVTQLA